MYVILVRSSSQWIQYLLFVTVTSYMFFLLTSLVYLEHDIDFPKLGPGALPISIPSYQMAHEGHKELNVQFIIS